MLIRVLIKTSFLPSSQSRLRHRHPVSSHEVTPFLQEESLQNVAAKLVSDKLTIPLSLD
jgi:hypothetical protein